MEISSYGLLANLAPELMFKFHLVQFFRITLSKSSIMFSVKILKVSSKDLHEDCFNVE